MSEPTFASAARDEHGRALLTLTIGAEAQQRVIRARGEVDISTADLLTECGLRELSTEPASLVLDLSGIVFFSAAGLRALLTLHREAGPETRVVLRDPSPSVRLVLELSGLSDELITPAQTTRR